MDFVRVGNRVREHRQRFGLTLSDLARAVGVSVSFLSMLENGKTTASLKVLDRICTHFAIHVASLFEEESCEDELLYPKSRQLTLSRGRERSIRLLLPRNRSGIEPVLITLKPGPQTQDFTSHRGVEFGFVLEGTIEVHIKDKQPITCREEDSVLYLASNLHKLVNPTDKVARGLWVAVPDAQSL